MNTIEHCHCYNCLTTSIPRPLQDLGTRDLMTHGMILICQIVRRGKMLPDDKKNVSQYPFRRPYACGVLEVDSVLQDMEKAPNTLHEEDLLKSFTMPLYLW